MGRSAAGLATPPLLARRSGLTPAGVGAGLGLPTLGEWMGEPLGRTEPGIPCMLPGIPGLVIIICLCGCCCCWSSICWLGGRIIGFPGPVGRLKRILPAMRIWSAALKGGRMPGIIPNPGPGDPCLALDMWLGDI